jgi:hypothetical protein
MCTGTGLGGTGDTCTAGVCAGPAVTCSDNNVCNGVETCDPASGCVGGTPPNCNDNDVCTTDTCDPVMGCQHGSDPASYALCTLNVLADAIQGTPAQELGGIKKKKKFMREVTASLKSLQKALAAAPRQRKKNLSTAHRSLSRLNDGLQKMVSTHQIQDALGNHLLDLVANAARALEALSS